MKLSEVLDENNRPLSGTGFAIKPQNGHVYAPFDGTVKFTFSTKHTLGIISDDGLEAIIHVGLGTVNLRGEGFVSHYQDGQKVKAGQLLIEFDQDLIKKAGYSDIVVTFFTQPKRIESLGQLCGETVAHNDKVLEVSHK